MIFLQLFFEFFKTGLFSIGGGMATIPFLQEISERMGWFSKAELLDMIAVSESTPGPLGINMSTYVGFKAGSLYYGTPGGVLGAIIATFALTLPSLIIIIIVYNLLNHFKDNKYVKASMYALRSASVALISSAGISVVLFSIFHIDGIFDYKNADLSLKSVILFFIILILSRYVPKIKKMHPVVFIFFAAIFGIVFKMS